MLAAPEGLMQGHDLPRGGKPHETDEQAPAHDRQRRHSHLHAQQAHIHRLQEVCSHPSEESPLDILLRAEELQGEICNWHEIFEVRVCPGLPEGHESVDDESNDQDPGQGPWGPSGAQGGAPELDECKFGLSFGGDQPGEPDTSL